MSSFTKGRIISFIAATAFVFVIWGYVFAPNGNGANVILGLAVALFLIYWATTSIGPTLDDLWFHGGSRERALALREAERTAQDVANKLAKMKARARSANQAKYDAASNAVTQTFETITQIRANPAGDARAIAADIKRAQAAQSNVTQSAEAVLGKSAVAPQSFLSGWFSLAVALGAAIALRTFIVEPYQIPSGSMIPTLLVGDHLFVSKLSYGIMNPFAKEPSYLVRWNTPQPGQVIIFQSPSYVPAHAGETWIKRVIAGPGQTVSLINSVVHVDGKPYAHIQPEMNVDYKDFEGSGSQGAYDIGGGKGDWKERKGIHTIEQIGDIKHDIYQNTEAMRKFLVMKGYGWESSWPEPGDSFNGLDCTATECKVKEGHIFVMGDNRGFSSDGRRWGALPIDNVKGKALFIWMSVDGSENSVKIGQFALPAFRWSRWFQGIN